MSHVPIVDVIIIIIIIYLCVWIVIIHKYTSLVPAFIMDKLDIEDLIGPIVTSMIDEDNTRTKQACRTGLAGKLYMEKLLNCQHQKRVYEFLRMQLPSFYALRDWCLANTTLKSSRSRQSTRGVTIEEKLAIFLYIVSNGASNRNTQEQFSHSGETISR